MTSQTLVVDLVRGWLPESTIMDYVVKRDLDYCDLAIVNTEPEWPGMEKVSGKVIWDSLKPLTGDWCNDRDTMIHTLFKRFGLATNTQLINVRHDGLVSYLDFKGSPITKVEGFEWIDQTSGALNEENITSGN